EEGQARRAVLGQGVLRPARGHAQARGRRRGADPRRAAVSVPARTAGRRAQVLHEGHRRGLVPGRAAQPGRLVPDPPPPGRLPGAEADAALRRPRAFAGTGRRPLQRPRRRAEAAGRRRAGQPARRRNRLRVTEPPFHVSIRTPHTMATEIKVPVLPESVTDATIASWHKKVGDAVKRDENIVDLETDKVVLEVPSTVDGVIKELKFEEGATVTGQQVIALIEEGAAAEAPK